MTVQEAQVDNLHEFEDEEFVDELTPGTQLMHGQYTIESFLNSGGFGITYLARDSLDRVVVIKECFPGSFCRRQNASVVARSRAHQAELRSIVRLFTQEARSLAKAGHPNIVGVHQVFEDNATAYMALDYVEGMDLLEIITETPGVLTPVQIRSYLMKMLDAISFVHKQGILHRDISPDNILIRSDNEPVLIDFGAAREEASKQSRLLSALRVVKDGYSPQEFYVAGSEQSNSCDLYSLAASFYHIITGELPPDSQMRLAAAAAGDPDPFVPLGKRTNDYDEVFCTSLDKAMSVLPRERIQSAEEWLAMLKGEAPVSAPNAQTTKRIATPRKVQSAPAKKSKMPLLLASTAVILGLAAAGYVATQGGTDAGETVLTPEVAQVAPAVTSPVDTPVITQVAPPVELPEVLPEVADVTLPAIPTLSGPSPTVTELVNAPSIFDSQDAVPTAKSTADVQVALASPSALPQALSETPFSNVSEPASAPVPEPAPMTLDSLPEGVELVAPEAPSEASQLPEGVELLAPLPAGVERVRALPEGVELVAPTPAGEEQAPALPEGVELVTPAAPAPATTEETASLAQEPVEIDSLEVSSVMSSITHSGLPFTFSDAEPGVVDSVLPGAPFWVAKGTRVLSINGEQISDPAQADALVKRLSRDAQGSNLRLNVTTEAQVSGAAIERNLVLPVVHATMLMNGLGFEARPVDGGTWQTEVVATPSGSPFQIGDQVIAFMPTSERIEGAETLREIVTRDLETGRTNFSFAIQRDGQMWVESFNLKNQ